MKQNTKMNSVTKVKTDYFTNRLINVLSSLAQILCLQFLYYAFHRLSGYKVELCFLIFFAQIPLTLNTLCNKMYITDDGYIYSSKGRKTITKGCAYCSLSVLTVNIILILSLYT